MTTFYNWMTIFYQIDFEKKKKHDFIQKNCYFQEKSLFQAIKAKWFKRQQRQIFTNGTLKAWRSNPTLREPQELFAMSRKTRFWLSREPCRFKVVTICFGFLSWKKGENGLIITNKKMWQTFFSQGQFDACLRSSLTKAKKKISSEFSHVIQFRTQANGDHSSQESISSAAWSNYPYNFSILWLAIR